jgi:ribonuclease J
VLVSCFATSIPRIQRVADAARQAGRAIGFIGRRMADNTTVAAELGALDIPGDALIPVDQVRERAPRELALCVSGSQGEPLSAMTLLSLDEHPALAVGPGDTVVFSARPIPGNERAVSRVIGNLFRRGADVVHPGIAAVHVSGHGSQDDLLELLRRVRPRFFVPVHGEYRMLAQHAHLARRAGLAPERVLLAEDGDVLRMGPRGARREARVHAGRTFLDRGVEELEDLVLRDRRRLSAEGIVVPVVVVDRQTGALTSPPEIVTRGFVDEAERGAELLDAARSAVARTMEERPREERFDPGVTRERLRQELQRLFKKRLQRRPMVIPVVMEV